MNHALARLNGSPVLVVGDLMADRYQWGEVQRISPEAPVPVVRIIREELRLGGAANVAHNLAALGCRVSICGLVGRDSTAGDLIERLTGLRIDTAGVIADESRPTTVKLRVMARHQQMLRCDWEKSHPAAPELTEQLLGQVRDRAGDFAAIVVSDYGKGVVGETLMAGLIKAGKKHGLPVIVDPKGIDFAKYRGVDCLTPNESEAATVARMDIGNEDDALRAGRLLMEELGLERMCMTRGANGVLAIERGGGHQFLPARAREVYDVTGAGDTFISMMSGLIAAGEPFFQAVSLANLAAGIAVGRVGTATVTVSDMLSAADQPFRLYTPGDIGEIADGLRAQGKRIVFTNGCFDLLHAGHIQYLRDSRGMGDTLIVGINSDDSVRRLKGPNRPVIGVDDRAHVLSALAFVDYVVVFDEDTPLEMIRRIRPAVLTKGADYTVNTVVGHELMAEWGGEVRLIPLKENRSSSGIIDRIAQGRGVADG